jgi:hypothetical protein
MLSFTCCSVLVRFIDEGYPGLLMFGLRFDIQAESYGRHAHASGHPISNNKNGKADLTGVKRFYYLFL